MQVSPAVIRNVLSVDMYDTMVRMTARRIRGMPAIRNNHLEQNIIVNVGYCWLLSVTVGYFWLLPVFIVVVVFCRLCNENDVRAIQRTILMLRTVLRQPCSWCRSIQAGVLSP